MAEVLLELPDDLLELVDHLRGTESRSGLVSLAVRSGLFSALSALREIQQEQISDLALAALEKLKGMKI